MTGWERFWLGFVIADVTIGLSLLFTMPLWVHLLEP